MSQESLHNKIGLQFFAEPGAGGAGGTDGGNGGNGGAGTDGGNAGGGTPPKTFTQEQVNTMMANEKRTARSALLKELGYEVKDGNFQEVVGTIKGILDQGKTQQQKDQEARQKAEGDLTTANAQVKSLQAKIDAMSAGVKPDYVDDAIALLAPRVTEEKPLSKLLEESKTKYPNWFGESGGSNGTGGSTNPARNKGGNAGEMGKRLAQPNATQQKSSFFKS